jgi:hypothetical protein
VEHFDHPEDAFYISSNTMQGFLAYRNLWVEQKAGVKNENAVGMNMGSILDLAKNTGWNNSCNPKRQHG